MFGEYRRLRNQQDRSIYDNFDSIHSIDEIEEIVSEEESEDELEFFYPPVLKRQNAVNYSDFHPGCLDGWALIQHNTYTTIFTALVCSFSYDFRANAFLFNIYTLK